MFVKLVLLLVTVRLSEEKGMVDVNIIEIANNQRNIMRNMIGRLNLTSLNASSLIQSKLSSVESQVTLHRQHKVDEIQQLIEATAIETLDDAQPDEFVDQPELPPTADVTVESTPPSIKSTPEPTSPVPEPTSPVPDPTSPVPEPTSPVPGPTSPESASTISTLPTELFTTGPVITRPVPRFRNPIYFRTCQEIFTVGYDISGMYIIDPDLEGELEAFFVYCSMAYGQGVTLVLVGEELEMPLEIHGDNRPGSFAYEPTYEPTFHQMAGLTSVSNTCQQYIQYTCQGSKLLAFHNKYKKHRGWLVSRDDEVLINWGGAPTNSTFCECGVTDSCITPGTKCNCDGPSSTDADQSDAGYLTDKRILPIRRVYLGDAAGSKTAFLTLGGLECTG